MTHHIAHQSSFNIFIIFIRLILVNSNDKFRYDVSIRIQILYNALLSEFYQPRVYIICECVKYDEN